MAARTDRVLTGLAGIVTRQRVAFIGAAFIAVSAVLLVASFVTAKGRQTAFGTALGPDYSAMYVAGTILNSAGASRLYDFGLQDEVYHELLPRAKPSEKLPYLYAPFFGLLLSPLARLQYEWAFGIWLVVSLTLYLLGFYLLRRACPHVPRETWVLALLVAVSFQPFLYECLISGQVSAFPFFWLCVALLLVVRDRPLLAGAGLAFCFYKPTMPILIVAMLLTRSRVKLLLGVLIGLVGLAAFTELVGGWNTSSTYLQALVEFSQVKATAAMQLRTWKYVDASSFTALLSERVGGWVAWLVLAAALAVLARLAMLWWRLDWSDPISERLAWACALTWSPVLNIHFAVYDSIVIIPGLLLTADLLYKPGFDESGQRRRDLLLLTALVYLSATVTQPLARATGLQVYTLALAALGFYQMRLAAERIRGNLGPA